MNLRMARAAARPLAAVGTFLVLSAVSAGVLSARPQPLAADAAKPAGAKFLLAWGGLGDKPGEFHSPIGLAINARDEVFVTDLNNARVQRFTSEGKHLGGFDLPIDTPPRKSCMVGGIAVDAVGQVYLSLMLQHRVVVYTEAGELVRGWGKPGAGDGEFDQPGGIALAPDGSVYVADQCNHRVQVFTKEGKFVRRFGGYGPALGQFGPPEPAGTRFGGPHHVALDMGGRLYTTEAAAGRVQQFDAAGGRPLMHHSVHQLERMFRAARSQRAVLQQLRGELRRRRSQRAQALLATVEAALRAQDVRPREPACRMCDAAGPDAGRFCPGCGRVRPQSDHRAVRPAVPVRDAVPAAAPPAPAVTSPPAPPPRTEAPWVSNGVLVVAIIAVVVILVVYRMVVLQR